MSQETLSLQILPLHPSFAKAPARELVLMRITATKELVGPRPRLSAILVLDVSGSMQGEPIAQVRRSAERLAEILAEDDALGVVAFESNARQVSALCRVGEGRGSLKRAVGALVAGGNTNLSGGMSLAALMFPPRAEDERQILLVMSDGQPNVGSTTRAALSQEAALIKGRGVAISSLGFGSSHNEDILVGVAEAGGGRYSFVSDPTLAESSFAKALGAQRDVVAQGVRLSLQPGEGVEIVKLWGDPKTSFGADGLRVPLQDLIAGDELNIIVELQVSPPAEPGFAPLRARLAWTGIGAREERYAQAALEVALSSGGAREEHHEVRAHLAITRAAELRTEARGYSDRRDFSGARQVLERAKAALEEVPEFMDHPALHDAWEALIDDIEMMKKIPSEADYQSYRRSQRDYNDFAAGGLNAKQQAVLTPSARAMSDRAAKDLPTLRLWYTLPGGAPQVLSFQQAEITLGRTPDCEVQLSSPSVSRRHARILFRDGAYWLFDLGSSNGVTYNNLRIDKQPLTPGVRFKVGEVELWIE
jgi:Ca-activated chloride channel homolog